MSEPIRVLLADDDVLARAGVRRVLQADGFEVCAEADDAAGALEAAVRERPHICLLEVRLPGDALTAVAEISGRLAGTAHVVMLSASTEDADVLAALRAGASGYLLKDMDPDRLSFALRGVLDGEAAVPRTIMARVLEDLRAGERRRLAIEARATAPLTPREREVLDLMASGMPTSAIAARLCIASTTVRRHVSEVLHKLELPDRASAMRLVSDAWRGPDT